MSKIFRITPKRTKRSNGQVLTPDMAITVTTRSNTTTPFYNGAVEIKEQYTRMYQFDYKKAARISEETNGTKHLRILRLMSL